MEEKLKLLINKISKLVFLIMALASVVGFFMKLLDAKQFMTLTAMAFSYYFGTKQE